MCPIPREHDGDLLIDPCVSLTAPAAVMRLVGMPSSVGRAMRLAPTGYRIV